MKQTKPRIKKTTIKTPLAKKKPKQVFDLDQYPEAKEFLLLAKISCSKIWRETIDKFDTIKIPLFRARYRVCCMSSILRFTILTDDIFPTITAKDTEDVITKLFAVKDEFYKELKHMNATIEEFYFLVRAFAISSESIAEYVHENIIHRVIWQIDAAIVHLQKSLENNKSPKKPDGLDTDTLESIDKTFPLKDGVRVFKEVEPGLIMWADKSRKE